MGKTISRIWGALEIIMYFFLPILAVMGALWTATIFHELSHSNDLHYIASVDGICPIIFPTSWQYFWDKEIQKKTVEHVYGKNYTSTVGVYLFRLNMSIENVSEINDNIQKYTEIKADRIDWIIYIPSGFVLLIFIIMFWKYKITQRAIKASGFKVNHVAGMLEYEQEN